MRRPLLQTGRLLLRPLQASDEAALVLALNDWEVARWLAVVPHPYGSADFHDFLRHAEPGIVWTIQAQDGLAGLIENDGVLGYWLARRAWGRGYATEAARAILAAHFTDPAAGAVASGYFEGNDRSAAVLRKLGFAISGYMIRRSRARPGQDQLSCRMHLTRAAWEAASPA
ncbi:GNAT family N-acetyltransferase [Frigidibacter sp. RF13]|uniref:GNAT family N-acetyltransferase n=1 Tax=Frigidibacter sp. RF13 TaxID=2997340 RepID=UPI00226E2938|nr:GNAT family N-acetyltransferase [Frigidibacter sp. RF13]MCY1125716.1 GNAT family N-acetyltransferase [Frigidibacter sp. RF13]